MERTISVEEKIRRAEEIYARKKNGNSKPIATVSVTNENKKDIRLLKNMIIQMLICVSIYFVVYTIKNNKYVFSEDFTNKANEILSYDTNFLSLYNNLSEQIRNIFNSQVKEEQQEESKDSENNTEQEASIEEKNVIQQEGIGEQGIGGAEENVPVGSEEKIENVENTTELSEAEQDIVNIKNTTSFIKPVQGIISSKYGQRDSATGTVPKNHTGTDIAANLGTKIIAATDGEVVLSSDQGNYGKHLKIQIGEVSIIYAHCNDLYVRQGEKVTQGQEIAEVGSTGNSTRTTSTF